MKKIIKIPLLVKTKLLIVPANFYTLNLKKDKLLQPLEDLKVSLCKKYKDIYIEILYWHYLKIDAFIKVANIGVRTDSRNNI